MRIGEYVVIILNISICSSGPLKAISEFDHFAMVFAVIEAL